MPTNRALSESNKTVDLDLTRDQDEHDGAVAGLDENWLFPFHQAVDDSAKLPPGWNGEDAQPPDLCALDHAKQVLDQCWKSRFRPGRILPSVEGGIAIVFESPDKYADIECFNTGEILAVISNRKSDPEVWSVDMASVAKDLEKIRGFIGQ